METGRRYWDKLPAHILPDIFLHAKDTVAMNTKKNTKADLEDPKKKGKKREKETKPAQPITLSGQVKAVHMSGAIQTRSVSLSITARSVSLKQARKSATSPLTVKLLMLILKRKMNSNQPQT